MEAEDELARVAQPQLRQDIVPDALGGAGEKEQRNHAEDTGADEQQIRADAGVREHRVAHAFDVEQIEERGRQQQDALQR